MKWILCAAAALALLTAGFFLGRIPPAAALVPAQEAQSPDESIPLLEGVTPQMLSADHWIGEGSDKLLLTSEEIAAFRENNPLFVYTTSPDGTQEKLFMNDLPETLSGARVRSLIEPMLAVLEASPLYIGGQLPPDGYAEALRENAALAQIPEQTAPQYAIAVRRIVASQVPGSDFAAQEADERYCSDFVSAEILPFTGVVILHESRDGAWCFVLSGSFCGWVPRDTLALCKDKAQWLSACQPEDYLVVTARTLVLDETAEPSLTAGMQLPMGTKIPLADSPAEQLHGRSLLGCYTALLPCRGKDGQLSFEEAAIAAGEEVSLGDLPMRSAAVLRQAFRFCGHVYGWGGSLSSNDCSGMLRQVYACFGLDLPRNARAIAVTPDLGASDCREMTRAKKLSILREMPAGLPLYMDGHIMLYLGMEGETPYVLSSCGSYIAEGDKTGEIQDAYCVFVSNMELLRKNGNTWLEDLSFFDWPAY